MQLPPLAREQLGVGGLAHELVPEGQPAVPRVGGEQVVRDGRAQRRGELGGGQVDERAEQLVVDPRAGGRRRAQHALRRRRERGDPRAEQVADRRRQLRLLAAGLVQLLGEEGVAAGPAGDRRGGGGLGVEQLGDLRLAERVELDPPDAVGARELGRPGAQRGAPRGLVAAVGGDEGDPPAAHRAGEVAGQVERRAVGPVHVLEHEQQRRRRGRLGQQVVGLPEQPRSRGRVGAHARAPRGARHQAGQLGRGARAHALPCARPDGAAEVAQRLREGQVRRRPGRELDAAAGGDERAAGRRVAGQLGQQARLADAGLAAYEGDRGPALGG